MFKLKAIFALAVVAALTGCAGVGDYVGGKDRCMSYSYNACTLKVENGIVIAGSTLDLHGKNEDYVDANPHESALRHAFSAITDTGGAIIGPRHNPTAPPKLIPNYNEADYK